MSPVIAVESRAERLPPEPASAGHARRFVARVLREWELDDMTDVASLLVSEVVTNAVLHAGTDLVLQVRREPDGLRVEVSDGSATAPARRHYDTHATTGRGIALVEMLADDWGVEGAPLGKTVWFAIRGGGRYSESGDGVPGARVLGEGEPEPQVPAPQDDVVVRLDGVPVKLLLATVQYGDAVLREAALLALSDDRAGDGGHWPTSMLDLTRLLRPVEEALARGEDTVDLELRMAAGSGEEALRRLALIDEVERLGGEGRLLSLPALPEVAACRRWYLGQIARQAQGSAPERWCLPDTAGEISREALLDDAERAQLDALGEPAIVADGTNHIIYTNGSAADLLGWTVEEMTGRRLTSIVPPELREAHLAGYTRYQVTGESHILGRTVTVPALHRDGSRLTVELTIDPLRRRTGTAFLATLRQL